MTSLDKVLNDAIHQQLLPSQIDRVKNQIQQLRLKNPTLTPTQKKLLREFEREYGKVFFLDPNDPNAPPNDPNEPNSYYEYMQTEPLPANLLNQSVLEDDLRASDNDISNLNLQTAAEWLVENQFYPLPIKSFAEFEKLAPDQQAKLATEKIKDYNFLTVFHPPNNRTIENSTQSPRIGKLDTLELEFKRILANLYAKMPDIFYYDYMTAIQTPEAMDRIHFVPNNWQGYALSPQTNIVEIVGKLLDARDKELQAGETRLVEEIETILNSIVLNNAFIKNQPVWDAAKGKPAKGKQSIARSKKRTKKLVHPTAKKILLCHEANPNDDPDFKVNRKILICRQEFKKNVPRDLLKGNFQTESPRDLLRPATRLERDRNKRPKIESDPNDGGFEAQFETQLEHQPIKMEVDSPASFSRQNSPASFQSGFQSSQNSPASFQSGFQSSQNSPASFSRQNSPAQNFQSSQNSPASFSRQNSPAQNSPAQNSPAQNFQSNQNSPASFQSQNSPAQNFQSNQNSPAQSENSFIDSSSPEGILSPWVPPENVNSLAKAYYLRKRTTQPNYAESPASSVYSAIQDQLDSVPENSTSDESDFEDARSVLSLPQSPSTPSDFGTFLKNYVNEVGRVASSINTFQPQPRKFVSTDLSNLSRFGATEIQQLLAKIQNALASTYSQEAFDRILNAVNSTKQFLGNLTTRGDELRRIYAQNKDHEQKIHQDLKQTIRDLRASIQNKDRVESQLNRQLHQLLLQNESNAKQNTRETEQQIQKLTADYEKKLKQLEVEHAEMQKKWQASTDQLNRTNTKVIQQLEEDHKNDLAALIAANERYQTEIQNKNSQLIALRKELDSLRANNQSLLMQIQPDQNLLQANRQLHARIQELEKTLNSSKNIQGRVQELEKELNSATDSRLNLKDYNKTLKKELLQKNRELLQKNREASVLLNRFNNLQMQLERLQSENQFLTGEAKKTRELIRQVELLNKSNQLLENFQKTSLSNSQIVERINNLGQLDSLVKVRTQVYDLIRDIERATGNLTVGNSTARNSTAGNSTALDLTTRAIKTEPNDRLAAKHINHFDQYLALERTMARKRGSISRFKKYCDCMRPKTTNEIRLGWLMSKV